MATMRLNFHWVNYRKFLEPFSLADIYLENVEDAADPDASSGLWRPMVEDFSEVDLSGLQAEEISFYLGEMRQNPEIPASFLDGHVCCVARNLGSRMKLRMYGVYSEVYRVRNEEKFHVTSTTAEAVSWLAQKTGRENHAEEAAEYFAAST